MADVKISQLPAATTPLAGTEQIPLVQSSTTKQITVSNLLTSANLGTPTAVNLANATNIPMGQAAGILTVLHGGTGTTTPGIVAGTNVTVTGTWPNQTVNASSSGSVTGVTATAPVVSSGGTAPVISMAAATTSANGYLTSTDWNTFNGKLSSGGALGTPSSGTATNLTGLPLTTGVTGQLPVANGGTGTATPSIVAGTNVTVSGTWPNQTINASGGGGGGDVSGPGSSTDNAVARFDSTTGKIIQNSGVVINDGGEITTGVWKGTEIGLSYGGTGGASASQARSNILPSYTGNAGKVLAVNAGATDVEYVAVGGSGTVTSVAVSGGTTGLTTSGGPITGAGTITLAGTLAVLNGGTGTTTPSIVAGTNVTVSGTWPNQTINASSSSQVYPGAGIANSTGTAWGTSYTTTGTGTVVALDTSPTFVTPVLGTPTSATLTNATGLPISTGVSGLGTGVATFLATPSSANLAATVTDETGTGSLVFATSPTLVTPALGTPSALVGTNITGTAAGLTAGNVTTNANLTGAVTSVGNATSLGSFSSANLLAALTDETGTGSAVFATSPTLVTPLLGTPTSVTLTNATGLPISTGVSGLGTGVATALAVAVGSAGAPVVNGGALGTPSSGTLTSATGLPISTGVSGLGTGVATFLATPSSANLATAVTDETGSGSLVFGTSPTLTNPTITNYTETAYSANSSTAITLALTNGTVQIITLTGNATITMPTAGAGKSFIMYLRQDATGSRTVTWSTVNWPGGTAPTITSTASKQDIYSFFSDGTSWYGVTVGQNYTQ
jgi:hypothetical protein